MLELYFCLLMAGIGLCVFPLIQKDKYALNRFLFVLNTIVFSVMGGYYLALSFFVEDDFTSIISLSFFFAVISVCSIIYFKDFKQQRVFKKFHSDKKIRRVIAPLIVSAFFLLGNSIFFAVLFSGVIEEGEDVYAEAYWAIIQTPLIYLVAILCIMGGLVRTVTLNKAANYIADLISIILPFMFWFLTILGIVPIPPEIVDVYDGNESLANFSYIILFLGIILILTGIMYVFQGVKTLQI